MSLKKLFCVIFIIFMITVNVYAREKGIFSEKAALDEDIDIVMNLTDKNGRRVKDFSQRDEIYKLFYLDEKADDEYIFEDYNGKFNEIIDYNSQYYLVIIPEIKDNQLIGEYWVQAPITEESKIYKCGRGVRNNIGYNTVYPMNKIENRLNVGKVNYIVPFEFSDAFIFTGIYVNAESGEYVLPVCTDINILKRGLLPADAFVRACNKTFSKYF